MDQLVVLLQCGVLPPFCNLLDAKDGKTIIVVLDGLTNILHTAEKMGESEKVAIIIEEVGGLDKLEALQHHENEKIYQKSIGIIDAFFSDGVIKYINYLFLYLCLSHHRDLFLSQY